MQQQTKASRWLTSWQWPGPEAVRTGGCGTCLQGPLGEPRTRRTGKCPLAVSPPPLQSPTPSAPTQDRTAFQKVPGKVCGPPLGTNMDQLNIPESSAVATGTGTRFSPETCQGRTPPQPPRGPDPQTCSGLGTTAPKRKVNGGRAAEPALCPLRKQAAGTPAGTPLGGHSKAAPSPGHPDARRPAPAQRPAHRATDSSPGQDPKLYPHSPAAPIPGGPFGDRQLSPRLLIDLISVYSTVSLICCVNGILIYLPLARG